jgi:hypothetical protein
VTLVSPESDVFPLATDVLLFYLCSMRRLAIPSDEAPEPARRAGLARQFRYWRGASGRRYLFSAIGEDRLADFRDAVVIFAEADGERLVGRSVFAIGAEPAAPPARPGEVVLVHLLAPTAAGRERIVADLIAPSVGLAA